MAKEGEVKPGTGEPAKDKAPVVTRIGNLGETPEYYTTDRSHTFIGKFSFAEHGNEGQSTWYEFVLFEDMAKKMQALPLAKGGFVRVIGKEYTKEIATKDGGTRTIHEIRGTALPTILAQRPPHSQPH